MTWANKLLESDSLGKTNPSDVKKESFFPVEEPETKREVRHGGLRRERRK